MSVIENSATKLNFRMQLRKMFRAMQMKAHELGVAGVAGSMLALEGDNSPLLEVRISETLTRGTVDEGVYTGAPTNVLASTMAMLATMYSHLRDTGKHELFSTFYEGEMHVKGGLCHQVDENTHYLVAFSGGNREENLAIARVGLDTLLQSS